MFKTDNDENHFFIIIYTIFIYDNGKRNTGK